MALVWLDVAGKGARAGSVVLGFIILSPVLVLFPPPAGVGLFLQRVTGRSLLSPSQIRCCISWKGLVGDFSPRCRAGGCQPGSGHPLDCCPVAQHSTKSSGGCKIPALRSLPRWKWKAFNEAKIRKAFRAGLAKRCTPGILGVMRRERAGEEEVVPTSWIGARAAAQSAGVGLPDPASHRHLRAPAGTRTWW